MEVLEETLPLEFEIKDIDSGSRTIIQAFAKYGIKDADNDISHPGMFTKTWQENKSRIKHLLNHDPLKPVGKPESIYDESGFAVMKSKIGTHKLGDDFLEMALSGLITEASYGGMPIKFKGQKGQGRELYESKLMEISSLTHWGSQQHTPLLYVRKDLQGDDLRDKFIKRNEALERFCKTATASDETIQMLLLEHKQLTQIILDISKTTEPEPDSTLPGEIKDAFTIFKNSLKR